MKYIDPMGTNLQYFSGSSKILSVLYYTFFRL